MKIRIINEKKFLKNDLNLILILEENEIFEKTIKGVRKKFGYPEEGYKTEITPKGKIKIINFTEEAKKQINQANQWIHEPIKDIIHAFGLPLCWWNTLYSIITLNLAIPPMRERKWYKPVEVRFIGGLEVLLKRLHGGIEHPNELETHIEIDIREGMTFAKLIKQLKKEKQIIERYLSFLNFPPDTHKIKDIKLRKEIMELKKEGKTDNEILDKLLEKYDNNLPFEPDYNIITKYRNRFKKIIQRIPKNKYFLLYLDKYLL